MPEEAVTHTIFRETNKILFFIQFLLFLLNQNKKSTPVESIGPLSPLDKNRMTMMPEIININHINI